LRAKSFHYTVAKLLFVAKRGRPDIILVVSFLTTRVKNPDLDDWKKLLRVLGYLKGSVNFDVLTWYIDGSYAVHQDMKGKSGATLMMGDSAVLSKSSKQKVNTRSLTGVESIKIDDALPTIQWSKNFLKDLGHVLKTVAKEDNRSSILLMKNSRLSSGKRNKHLNVQYFYVKDLIDRGIVKIEHCGTEKKIAHFFTKPIQGTRFKILRDIILNIDHSSA